MSDETVKQLLTGLEEASHHAPGFDSYYLVLVLGSTALALMYAYRYFKISKSLPKGYSEDFKSITVMVIVLCGWNLLITCLAPNFFNNISLFSHLQDSDASIKANIRLFSHFNTEVFTLKNWSFFVKDCKFFAFVVISMVLFNGFSISILKIIEFISFSKSNNELYENIFNEDDMEKLISFSAQESGADFDAKPKKSVSFDSTLTTFNYLNSNSYVTTENYVVVPVSNVKRTFTKYLVAFVCTLVVYVFALPNKLMMNSSSCLLNVFPDFIIRFDHIYFTVASLFVLDVMVKFASVANHPSISNFPQLTSILSHFSWCYCSISLVLSFCMAVIFNDVLFNIVVITIQSVVGSNNTFQDVPRQLFTLIFINYIQHCVNAPACNGSCSSPEYFASVNEAYIWLRTMFINSWIVTNFTCFVVLPMFIWIVVIELKLKKI